MSTFEAGEMSRLFVHVSTVVQLVHRAGKELVKAELDQRQRLCHVCAFRQ